METLEITKKEAKQEPKPITSISGSVAVLEAFLAEGVETIFGYPGGAIMPIYDALYDYNDRLKHILVRHEQGAIHAAQGFCKSIRQCWCCIRYQRTARYESGYAFSRCDD